MRTPEQNYMLNTEFRMMTDHMEKLLSDYQFSPAEMREAAMLACVHFEMRRARPLFVDFESLGHTPPEGFGP